MRPVSSSLACSYLSSLGDKGNGKATKCTQLGWPEQSPVTSMPPDGVGAAAERREVRRGERDEFPGE